MKKTVLKNGFRAGLGLFLVNIVLWFTVGKKMPFEYAEYVGWTLILLACSFVFIGIKEYRDHENAGKLAFGEALKIGSVIALFPSAGVFVFECLLWTFSGKEFLEYYKAGVQNTMPPEDFAKMVAEIEANPAYTSPVFQGSVMFATVFLTGLAVAVAAGMLLRKS